MIRQRRLYPSLRLRWRVFAQPVISEFQEWTKPTDRQGFLLPKSNSDLLEAFSIFGVGAGWIARCQEPSQPQPCQPNEGQWTLVVDALRRRVCVPSDAFKLREPVSLQEIYGQIVACN